MVVFTTNMTKIAKEKHLYTLSKHTEYILDGQIDRRTDRQNT